MMFSSKPLHSGPGFVASLVLLGLGASLTGAGCGGDNPQKAARQIDMSAAKANAKKNFPDDPLSQGAEGGAAPKGGSATKAESGGSRGAAPETKPK